MRRRRAAPSLGLRLCRRGLDLRRWEVVVEEQGVEDHAVFAEGLPPVDRVVREHQDPSLARWGLHHHRTIANLIGAAHEAAQDPGIASLEAGDDAGGVWRRADERGKLRVRPRLQDRAVRPPHRQCLGRVAEHHGVLGAQNLALHVGPGRVPGARRPLGLDAAHEAELGGEVAGDAEGHQQPAGGHELVELRHSLDAHPAAHVVGLRVEAQRLERVVLAVGQRAGQLRLLEHQRLAALRLVRYHDDVVPRAQVRARAHVVLVDQVERHLPAIERQPHPAHLLGVRPGRVDGDARQVDVDQLPRRSSAHRTGDQAKRLDLLAHAVGLRPARGDDEGAGGVLPAAHLEGRLRGLERHVRQPVAQRDQIQGAVVLHGDHAAGAGDGAPRLDVGGQHLRRRIENGLVVNRPHLDIARQPHRPGAVVVGAQVLIRIGLLFEQGLGQPAVRLVQPHDVRPGWEWFPSQPWLPRSRDGLRWPAAAAD